MCHEVDMESFFWHTKLHSRTTQSQRTPSPDCIFESSSSPLTRTDITLQPPYNTWKNLSQSTFLFDLDTDYHELHDLSSSNPSQFQRMSGQSDVKGEGVTGVEFSGA